MNLSNTTPDGTGPSSITTPRTWIRAGFFFALGVAFLFVLYRGAGQVAEAALAVATPFVIATVLALLLDPIVDRLEKRKFSRLAAVAVVFGVFLIILISLGSLIIPALVSQAAHLAGNSQDYFDHFKSFINEQLKKTGGHIGKIKLPANFDAIVNKYSDTLTAKATEYLQQYSGKITGFIAGSIAMLLDFVITLILTFYLLVDIDRFRARLLFLLPSKRRDMLKQVGSDVGDVFSSYLRGLLIVCALYGVATTLMLYGLAIRHHEVAQYALLVGVLAGILYAVPYIGALSTGLLTFLVAFVAGDIGFGGLAVVLTLVLNQVFDNVITPRVVGGGVGLHPVTSLFALTLGGHLFGIWGLLLSVPVAGSIQVILYRVFPKLTKPTPPEFLEEVGLSPDEGKSTKILADHPQIPEADMHVSPTPTETKDS